MISGGWEMKLREFMPELKGAVQWLNSSPITRADVIGEKPTLFHFWSVSCDSCKKGMSNMTSFYQEYRDKLNVVTVHMPRSEEDRNLEAVKQTANDYHLTEPIFVDNEHVLTELFKNRYVPSFYLFDRNGKLRFVQSGKTGTPLLRNRLNRLLKE